MDDTHTKLRRYLVIYAIFIFAISIWMAFSGVGYYPPPGHDEALKIIANQGGLRSLVLKLTTTNSLFAVIAFFSFWFQWLASLLLLIGAINLAKQWSRKVCFIGIWIFLIFLVSYTIGLISEIILPVKFWFWDWLRPIVPAMVLSYTFSIFIMRRLNRFKVINKER